MTITYARRYTDRGYRCLKWRMAKNLDQYAERFIKKFGQRVRRLRQERGWTLVQNFAH